jgi:hypothetical protein
MRVRLVLPGDHHEYLNWLARHDLNPGDYRPLYREHHMLGLRASDVVSFDQVGTYWRNPLWGTNHYRGLMDTALSLDLHWAMPWEVDFLRAEVLRNAHDDPVTPWEIAAMAADQAEMEQMLG